MSTRVSTIGARIVVAALAAAVSAVFAAPQTQTITADAVKRHTMELADDKYEGRGAGYPGERRAADYIAGEFKKIGLSPAGDAGSYFQEFTFHVTHPVKPWEVLSSRNVMGRIPGSDPALRGEVVVIGAHFDGQGRTGQADPIRALPASAAVASSGDEIWNSANDNAASVAALLEIARALKYRAAPLKRSVLFIAFGAEEHGMIGSIHYIAHPVAPLADHVGMINLEKIGRLPEKPFNIVGSATSPAWVDILKAGQQQIRSAVVMTNPFAVPESDHYPFAASRIPAIMIIVSGAPDSHLPSDTADRIDGDRVAEAARLVAGAAEELASRPLRPSFVPPPFADIGLSAHLALPSEADARNVAAPFTGLKVTGVIAGLPGAAAGLQPGDLITEIGGYQFKRDDTLQALMTLQQETMQGKRGFVLSMKVKRGEQSLDLTMNLRPEGK
jgi:hypothetical protein